MKKLLIFFGGVVVLSSVLITGAQTVAPRTLQPPTGVLVPVRPVPVSDDAIVQFENLTIQTVSGAALPGTITTTPSYEVMSKGGIQKLPRPVPLPESLKKLDTLSSKCFVFPDQKSERRAEAICPTPVGQPPGTTGGAIVPITASYTIHVGAEARLFLRNREAASFADFTVGNQINVYGFYNNDGTVRALILRNLSKPDEKRFIQLNNVHLISMSSTVPPTQLVVAQRPDYPCYGFDVKGERQTPIVCPIDVQSSRGPSALSNVQVPETLTPIWNTGRRYTVAVDNQTILLDRNRNRITLGDLVVGDQLNIYGGTSGNGEGIDADIIRDISKPVKPPTADNFSGTVTQVNADGSFVIETEDRRTFTVENQIRVGVTVKVKGVLDQLKNLISQVSEVVTRAGDTHGIPSISRIEPPYGRVGTTVVLSGSGFTLTGNNINFAGTRSAVANVSSPDGATLNFVIPATPCAPNAYCIQVVLPFGTYPLSVTNQNGTSNEVKFSVEPGPSGGRGVQ